MDKKYGLKAGRFLRGMTQKELAEKSGVDIRLIQHYEQGTKNINHARVETVIKLADALELDVRQILN